MLKYKEKLRKIVRKLILFCLLLFVGVFCSACINSLAVYELNEKAVKLMEDGDAQGAISRWESSVDLDPNVYETRYNLANAYINLNQCAKALAHAKAAQEISKKEPIANYVLAIAYECSANQLIETKNENGETIKKEFTSKEEQEKVMSEYIDYIENSVKNYDVYVSQMQNAEDSDAIIKKINELKQVIQETKANELNN